MSLTEAKNAIDLFTSRVKKSGGATALRWKEGGRWRDSSWSDWDRASREIAAALADAGVGLGDRVCILSSSRPAWVECDVGILMAGAVTVPIYHSNLAHECEYVLDDCGAKVLFAENPEQVRKAIESRGTLPGVAKVVYFDETQRLDKPDGKGRTALSIDDVATPETKAWLQPMSAFRARGRELLAADDREQQMVQSWANVKADDMFTIVYTSGTTGPPKGVVLTHANVLAECNALKHMLPFDERDEQLIFLPLAHIFAKALEWATVLRGSKLTFAESIPQLKANLLEVRPTFMCSVPRVLEKVYLGILGARNASPPLKRKIFDWALSVGYDVSRRQQKKQAIPPFLAAQRAIAHKLVFEKIHAQLGGRLRFMVSGGAPLSKEIAEFFHAVGLLVCEGWGLTETCAGATVNHPDDYAFGTVGKPVPTVEVRIAADGEILVKGGIVMKGYFNKPEATAEVIDAGGWFHTGDIGMFVDGHLKITDRKKDIIVTAGGKNIAPQNLDGFLKATPYISLVMVHGDKRPYLVALVTLNEENIRRWASDEGLGDQSLAQLVEQPKLRALIQTYVDQLNAREPSYSSLKKFQVLPCDFTQETGELTPTLKVKRKLVYEKFRSVVDGLYA